MVAVDYAVTPTGFRVLTAMLRHREYGVPPQARGWSLAIEHDNLLIGGSPAGAGMVLENGAWPRPSNRFPRRRGDGPYTVQVCATVEPFPRERRGGKCSEWA